MPKKRPNFDASLIRFGAPPPTDHIPGYDILSPKPDGEVKAIILSDRVMGVPTHYVSPRTNPCIGEENGCVGCERKIPQRWKGYLCGLVLATARKVIVELTHGVVLDPRHAKQFASDQLRGLEIVLWRKNRSRNAPVLCKLQSPSATVTPLPKAFDLKEALIQIWEGKRPPGWTPASDGEQHEPGAAEG